MALPNPWEKIKQKASEIVPPIVTLKEQAHLLTEATEGVLQGFIKTEPWGVGLKHNLQVVVPAMNNYTVGLLWVIHPILLYPCDVDAPGRPDPAIKCGNREELVKAVVSILEQDSAQRTVSALLAQATSTDM